MNWSHASRPVDLMVVAGVMLALVSPLRRPFGKGVVVDQVKLGVSRRRALAQEWEREREREQYSFVEERMVAVSGSDVEGDWDSHVQYHRSLLRRKR